MSELQQSFNSSGDVRRIRFVEQAAPGETVLGRFAHPTPRYAVLAQDEAAGGDTLEVLLLPAESSGGFAEWLAEAGDAASPPAISVKSRGVEVWWRPRRAVLQCAAEQVQALLAALAEFAHYEGELRRIEAEIHAAWAEAEEDKALAFAVTSADLRRSDVVGKRMAATLQRRIRLARMEPHLFAPDPRLGVAGERLGDALREETEIEVRAEIVDGQLEVFEHFYEMGSQRMGEYKASRQGYVVELVIVGLLLVEALLMLAQVLRKG